MILPNAKDETLRLQVQTSKFHGVVALIVFIEPSEIRQFQGEICCVVAGRCNLNKVDADTNC